MAENVITHHSAVEIDPRDAKSPPQRRGSIAEHPLNKLSVHELRQLLDARQIKYDTVRDKDDLIQLAIDKGLTNEGPAQAESGQQSGARAESRFEGELSDGCEHYDPATMRAAALREALRRRGVTVSEEASRDELIRAAEDAGIGSESKHSA